MFSVGRDRYLDSFVVTALVRGRLDTAIRSPDAITRSLALAGLEPIDADDGVVPQQPMPPSTPPDAVITSTIIHGTFAWKGNWWRPGGSFHQFILGNYRPNLFSRGTKYSWSGALSARQRSLAASEFVEWAAEVAPDGVQTLFAHSYGGDIACRAANSGRCINELVLLSTPVTGHVKSAARSGVRVVDVRLRFDPVLALTARPQRIRHNPNMSEVLLRRWRLDHAATHEEQVWRDEDIARRSRL
jgi:pimeloyl-ACP methyl ester carboxylesterase